MIRLKSLTLKTPVIQAPMAGCTDLAFRLISRKHGMELAFIEMIASEALIRRNRKTLLLLKRKDSDKPIGAQIVGKRPDIMAEAAGMMEDLGFDLVDINLGCPVRKIAVSGGGSALLAEPGTVEKIFKAVTRRVKRIPVTAKLRKGFAAPTGEEALRIAEMAEACGLDAVTIHGRMRKENYSHPADWKIIEKAKHSVRIPVFGNGDILCGPDAKRMMTQTGCDAVMVGRGSLGNPWIFGEIRDTLAGREPKPPRTFSDIRETALRHFELEIDTEGEKIGLLKSRRILCWYFKRCPGVSEFRKTINRAESAQEVRDLVRNFPPPAVFSRGVQSSAS